MRGLFTAGALDYFLDHNIVFDYVIGVSAGACNAASYLSKQRGRNLLINTKYVRDKRYLSVQNFVKEGSMFGMDFVFNQIPNRLEPFDYETMLHSPTEFVVGVTDVETGSPCYCDKSHLNHNSVVVGASSAIPVFSRIVKYQGGRYLDGGTSDPIPVKKALEDGCERVVVVLTRERGYIKRPEKMKRIYSRVYRDLPNMVRVLNERHNIYNQTLEYLTQLEKQGVATVIAPSVPPDVGRFEKNEQKLRAAYQLGYDDTQKVMEQSDWF